MADLKTVKKAFRELCLNEFPGKIYKLNLYNNNKWFYVQAGNHFKDYIHYEYRWEKKEIHFHIEFDTKEENEKFYSLLPDYVKNQLDEVIPIPNPKCSYCKWFKLRNGDGKKELEKLDGNSEEIEQILYDAFFKMINLIEPCIELLEKGALRNTVRQFIDEYSV